jgi:hypothetical protein
MDPAGGFRLVVGGLTAAGNEMAFEKSINMIFVPSALDAALFLAVFDLLEIMQHSIGALNPGINFSPKVVLKIFDQMSPFASCSAVRTRQIFPGIGFFATR